MRPALKATCGKICSITRPVISRTSSSSAVSARHRGDVAAVAQHRDAVADAADLADPMGDVDDARAVPLDLLDQAEQLVGLALGERGGRLVEDQHRELRAERLGDLDHLLLGAGEEADLLARAQREAEPGEDLLGAPVQLALVEQAATGRLGAEEQVLLDRHLRHQGELLEDRADAERAGVMHRVQLESAAPRKRDPPGIGPERAGGDRDQGRLAGAVLAEQDVDLARPQVEIDLVERQHAGKALGDRLEAEQGRARLSGRAALLRRRGRHRPRRPHSTEKVGLKSSGASDDDRSKVSMLDSSIT